MYLQSHILITNRNQGLENIKNKTYSFLKELSGEEADRTLEIVIENEPSIGIKHIKPMHEWNSKKSSSLRIGLIYNAHLLTHQAQNAIVKLVEEPNNNTFIALITNSKSNLLETIISRCKIHVFEDDFQENNTYNAVEDFLKAIYTEQKNLVYDYAQDRKNLEQFLDSLLEYFSIKNSETSTSKYNQNMVELLGEWSRANSSSVNTKLIAQSILLHLGNYE
ncbi:hypothetical protein KC678_05070 [Candidatus Dojkabacteria bacterium]|uniref:DNA polymerase III subunit delta n=1 Tax=Candidatus Dojkabacteria bacterium TaxID=2099670 RepID=A0A955RGS6_9BACT|nr:hypothetical protein [Candidatus Dojkabacteria bacterium]